MRTNFAGLAFIALITSSAVADTPAEYEEAARAAFARRDCPTAFAIGHRFRTEHPADAIAYWVQIAAAAMPPCKPPENDTDLQDLAKAIRELRRRKLTDWDKPVAVTTYQRTFEWRADLARKQGDFDKAIAILGDLRALGDARSRAQADIKLGLVFFYRYFDTELASDARSAREAFRKAIGNQEGLTAEGYDDRMRAQCELLYGLAEAQLGNKTQALAALERAAVLDPEDTLIAELLVKARAPRWLTLAEIMAIVRDAVSQ